MIHKLETLKQQNMEQPKEYYAVISYKRYDEKWAKWLHDWLRYYKFPTKYIIVPTFWCVLHIFYLTFDTMDSLPLFLGF